MNALTVIILAVMIVSLIMGYNRGIVRAVGSLCAILFAVLACRLWGDLAADGAAQTMGISATDSAMSLYAAKIVGYGALFLVVWLGVFFLARMVRGAIRAVKLGVIDSFAGALFSCVKWLLVLSLFLNLIYIITPHAAFWGSDPPQGVVKIVLHFAPWLFGALTSAEPQM